MSEKISVEIQSTKYPKQQKVPSKVIVRTEQNNFAGGGGVAGLVLWAAVAARRAEVRTSGPNLVPPRSMWN
jgi:hypothetical protein